MRKLHEEEVVIYHALRDAGVSGVVELLDELRDLPPPYDRCIGCLVTARERPAPVICRAVP